MKKIIVTFISVLLCITLLVPELSVFAQTEEPQPEWEDITLTTDELEQLIANNGTASPYATGLISKVTIAIAKQGNNIVIAGLTDCTSQVVKCGFKEVVIQRRASSSSSWSNYLTYNDLYADGTQYILSKTVAVPSGYQYRVTCKHYAKKNIFSTQTINNTSNIV